MINQQDAERIARAINAYRPDWPLRSLLTLITRDLADWPSLDALVGLAYIAADRNIDGTYASRTPARVREDGPWRHIGSVLPPAPKPRPDPPPTPEQIAALERHRAWRAEHPTTSRLASPDWYSRHPPAAAYIDPQIRDNPDPTAIGPALAKAAIPTINRTEPLPWVPADLATEAAAPLPPAPDDQADTDGDNDRQDGA